MEVETTEAVRQAESLQNTLAQQRILLKERPKNTNGKENFNGISKEEKTVF
jgi:hypothetical protein